MLCFLWIASSYLFSQTFFLCSYFLFGCLHYSRNSFLFSDHNIFWLKTFFCSGQVLVICFFNLSPETLLDFGTQQQLSLQDCNLKENAQKDRKRERQGRLMRPKSVFSSLKILSLTLTHTEDSPKVDAIPWPSDKLLHFSDTNS